MEKALRRQVGADTVDLDTQDGYAHYTLARPREIDFAAIEKAAYGAGYTLKGLTVEVSGTLEKGACESCGTDIVVLRVFDTDQRLELDGELPIGMRVWLEASVSEWAGSHPRLSVLDWHEEVD